MLTWLPPSDWRNLPTTARSHALSCGASYAPRICPSSERGSSRFSSTLKSSTNIVYTQSLQEAKLYKNTSEAQASTYDRDNILYPYKSHGQWLKACYGLVACILLIIFNGVASFLRNPFHVQKFIAAYISVSFFPRLSGGLYRSGY